MGRYRKAQKDDFCIIYITKIMVFGGIFKIISKGRNKELKWNSGVYQDLLNLKPIKIATKMFLIKDHIDQLSFIKNKQNWNSYFRFSNVIPEIDLHYVLDKMK